MSSFSFQQRLRLAWELTWPVAAIDLAVMLVVHGVLNVTGDSFDSVWALGVILVVSPWAVRRAFGLPYGGRRIQVAPGGSLGYSESLKVMWLLAWRSLIIVFLAILVFSALLRAFGFQSLRLPGLSPLSNAVGLSMVDSVIGLGATPFLIPGMLRKKYKGFRLVVA